MSSTQNRGFVAVDNTAPTLRLAGDASLTQYVSYVLNLSATDPGNDVIIGGTGKDDLKGGDGDDLILGGYTSFDNDPDALNWILTEWRSALSYADRINNLQTGVGPQQIALKTNGPDATVFDDGDKDKLKGEKGRDWFLGDDDDDDIKDRKSDEVFTDIDLLKQV